MSLTYLDFELEISVGSGSDYPIAVLRSPAGEARATLHLPWGELALENRLKDLKIALLQSGGVRRQILSPEELTVQLFGRELFDALIVGEVRSRYDVSQERARQQGKGLRLKLRIQPAALAALPWEFLYDERTAEYVCLSRTTPIVRYMELPQAIQPLNTPPPLRILGMIVSPTDLQTLDVTVEKQRVERAVADLQKQGMVELTWLNGQTWRDLQRALRGGPWHIFHFVGHGGFDAKRDEGLIALADANGEAQFLSATELGRLLADHHSLRLVLLNSCDGARAGTRDLFSSTASILVRRGIPAVVAMQYPITDKAAIEFAQTFYESLADQLPVDAAVAEARKAISLAVSNSVEWGTPVLFMRAADGHLFTLDEIQAQRKDAEVQRREEKPGQSAKIPAQVRTVEKPVALTLVYPTTTIEFDWVTVPAGEFLMGSNKEQDPEARNPELPQHRLYLPEYRLARVPVTNAQYKQFVEATGHRVPEHWENGRIPQNKEKHPVVYTTWHDALAFCQWAKVRLPTEAEWEKAARGTDGRKYPWGNQAPDQNLCNFNSHIEDTTPVGNYPKGVSPYGALDMVGNVWEWTSSLWGKDLQKPEFIYPYQPDDGREDLSAPNNVHRVVRGGSFGNDHLFVRAAVRSGIYPDGWYDLVGFRLVLSPSPLASEPSSI